MNEEQLVINHTGLVYNQLKRFTYDDDIKQAGFIGLLKAIRTYNPAKGKFSTWASRCIRNEMLREINKTSTWKQVNCSVPYIYHKNDIFFDILPETLTHKEEKIIEMKRKGYSLTDIGHTFNHSCTWAKNQLIKAIDKIRKANEET